MSSELAVIESKAIAPTEAYRQATDVAGVCKELVVRTAVSIQGRKYIQVSGWTSIAAAHGCLASARDVERVSTGYRAIGEVRRIRDGAVLSTAEGFVGDDEPTWASRPEYARRAMAQTRAISRACRTAFSHVVVMMDADLSTVPAEEVPDGGFNDASKAMPSPAGVDALRAQLGARPSPAPAAPRAAPQDGAPSESFAVRYGNAKGKYLGQLSVPELQWYADGAAKSVDDPTKANFRASNEKELATLRAWIAFRA